VKKKKASASKSAKPGISGGAKPVKSRAAALARSKPQKAAAKKSAPAPLVSPDDPKSKIRQLKKQLARALATIDELQAAADMDYLLDIPNRRGFERELHRSVAYIQRYGASGALIVLDVDRLKPINDRFGHSAGDEVLKAVVSVLRRHVRASDVLGRLGGDEFALLLWNLSATDARAKAAALEETLDGLSFVFGGHKVSAGASAGVAMLGAHAEAGRALEEADSAMYVRKAQRRHENPLSTA
jgi:diguanylate cyclase (GGDEF)-like protein